MTDWMNVEDVRAAVAKAVATTGKWSHAATTDYHRMNAWQVLEALAELPEPDAMCDVEGCPFIVTAPHAQPDTWVVGSHAYQEPLLHRLWSIARLICGKEES